jgi:hypothetical protein
LHIAREFKNHNCAHLLQTHLRWTAKIHTSAKEFTTKFCPPA